ncbi:MAG: hypothetical protein U0269_36695 [Polyangiales bacterium]
MSESAQPEPTEIAVRLRPTIERGCAALLVGGTVAQRSEWIERALTAASAAEAAPPLVVRVRPRAPGSLADELTARAEEALERLRAPGGLYEESSCSALPALGGWLFRARSVRRSGLLFVIEEVDGYLDLRGDRDRAEDALEALGLLLEERERRPVSLLCSVRAADAAGSPAIPAAIVALFDERASLGAASAVARDPSSLVAALSGRSFTRESLARAVAAWTDVSDDESVIVFSSPLSPTMVPAAVSADEPEVRWPSEAPPPEQRPSVAPESPSDAATAERPSAKGRSRAKNDAEHARYMPTFRAAIDLRSALDALGEPAARRSTRQLERAFSRSICRIPLALEALRTGAPAVGANVAHLERRAAQTLALFEKSFAEAYSSAFTAWAAGATRPTMLPDLVQRLHELATECGARSTALVLCTGLRADEWPALSAALRSRAAGVSVLEEGLHWAARPVTVAAQRAMLARGAAAIGAPINAQDEPPAPRSLEEAALPRREVTSQGEFQRISAYRHVLAREIKDGKEAKDGREAAPSRDALQPLSTRFEKARSRVAPSLAAFVAGLPSGSLVLFAADVGAAAPMIATDDSRASDAPREPSVFEVLVPHAFLLWGG